MDVDQMKEWLTKFHADGVYFHVAPLAKASPTPAAGDKKAADDPIPIWCSRRSEREQHSATPQFLERVVGEPRRTGIPVPDKYAQMAE